MIDVVKIAQKFLNFKFLKESTWFKNQAINPNSFSNQRFKIPLKFTKTFNRKLQNKSHVLNNIQMIQKSKKKLEFIQISHKLTNGSQTFKNFPFKNPVTSSNQTFENRVIFCRWKFIKKLDFNLLQIFLSIRRKHKK